MTRLAKYAYLRRDPCSYCGASGGGAGDYPELSRRGDIRARVLDAMRSGEWLREQWITRVAYDMGAGPWSPRRGSFVRRALQELEQEGRVGRRDARERRTGDIAGVAVEFSIPRDEWRLS